jgi:predicted enzyme related to lactoylglutathione lyase
MNPEIQKKQNKNPLLYAALGLAIIGVLTLISFMVLLSFQNHINTNEIDLEKASQIGDFFAGVVGLTFTIVATILVYLTYQTQKEEAKSSSGALKLQARASQLQQFENTFFNLLSNHREVLQSIQEKWLIHNGDGVDNHRLIQGKNLIDTIVNFIKTITVDKGIVFAKNNHKTYSMDYFIPYEELKKESIYDDFELEFVDSLVRGRSRYKSKLANAKGLASVYEKIFLLNRSSLGHYFRNLFHLIKFVHEYEGFNESHSKDEIRVLKYKYVRLVRAQLSNNELILLALNSTIWNFDEDWSDFLRDYNLFRNVDLAYEFTGIEGLLDTYPHFKSK